MSVEEKMFLHILSNTLKDFEKELADINNLVKDNAITVYNNIDLEYKRVQPLLKTMIKTIDALKNHLFIIDNPFKKDKDEILDLEENLLSIRERVNSSIRTISEIFFLVDENVDAQPFNDTLVKFDNYLNVSMVLQEIVEELINLQARQRNLHNYNQDTTS